MLLACSRLARRAAALLALAGLGCGGSGPLPPEDAGGDPPPPRRISLHEVEPPYLDDPALWARDDLYVMHPDLEPLDRWPEEVLVPAAHGIRIIVLLPGDYTARSNGRLAPGVLFVESSGTPDLPLLVTYAPHVGADILAAPHPAERLGGSEARLRAIRVWNEDHQVFHGLTFADGVSACLLRETEGSVIDRCLWHETTGQPLRIRFGARGNVVQRCVMRRFDRMAWGGGDTVAIQVSDGACTHNRIVSNVILNYTDAYQHTDRDGEPYGLGAGTIIDNNVMGFTPEAYVAAPEGELMCGENAIDLKMGGTEAEPVLVTNNVFFGTRAALAGCAASGSGGYAITLHRRGTWVVLADNLFVDVDAGVFLNAFFQDVDSALGRIDPHVALEGNVFSGVESHATAFPSRTGHVLTGSSPATFLRNHVLASDRLMEQEPLVGVLRIGDNDVYGALDLTPRDQAALEADGNVFHPATDAVEAEVVVPWSDRRLPFLAPP